MALLKLPDNGQETELDDTIARSDDLLKQALAIVMPGAANIEIKREETGGQLIVTVIKKAGSKGNYLLALMAADDEPNPAVKLATELQLAEATGTGISWEELLEKGTTIDQAITDGLKEARQVGIIFHRLKCLPAVPATSVPQGF